MQDHPGLRDGHIALIKAALNLDPVGTEVAADFCHLGASIDTIVLSCLQVLDSRIAKRLLAEEEGRVEEWPSRG